MIQQRFFSIPALVALFCVLTIGAASAVKAGSQIYEGLVKHVSTQNLQVYNPSTKKTLTFVLVPHFGNITKSDGRTAQSINDLKAGQYVKVYYDQKAFGIVHADRILIMSSSNVPMKTNHS